MVVEVMKMTKISKNIKRLRMLQNMSQEELAQKLFVSRQAVSSWENNRTQPDLDMIQKIAELFGVEVESVNTMNVRGHMRRYGRYEGYKPSWKKAVVTLTEGSKTIEFFDGMF